ncbi:MBL fold metallo-hydrolase [Sinomonas susongensis]|uniref:MBL fold metallo-hydrolase n=1 Tax=Sinomonas susongensis TaxID=1324851 RepID=UPI0011094B5B|nr:MBL fold metallo-hydrolase [Sinomonas susongensis]
MESIYPSVFRLQHSAGSNGYALHQGDRVALVDPGLPNGSSRVLKELGDEGLLERVTDVLVTHSDLDHLGAAAAVQAATGATVWLGRADAEILEGKREPSTRFRRLLARRKAPSIRGPLQLLDGGEVPFPGVRAIATPGHTPGHMVFTFGEVVFAGDAVRGSDDGLRLMPGILTSDMREAKASLGLIAGLGARWLCPGHGRVRELRAA